MNGNASGYNRDLFERVLVSVNAPCDRVRTILLWRGFLARGDEAGTFLWTGSADGDTEMLRHHGFEVERINGHPDNFAEIRNPDAVTD